MSEIIVDGVTREAYHQFQRRYDAHVASGRIQPLFGEEGIDKFAQACYIGHHIEDCLEAIYLQGITDMGPLMRMTKGHVNPFIIKTELDHYHEWSKGDSTK